MKVFCKKDMIENNFYYFQNNQYYTVRYDYDDCYWINFINKNGSQHAHRFMKGNKINEKIRHGKPLLFNEYFINVQELRKLKIEKLNKFFLY